MPGSGTGAKAGQVRPLALCVFRRNDEILVTEYLDAATGERYYRPLGGGIEFGEHGQDAVKREIREEIGAQVASLSYLGAVENTLTRAGTPGHEIVMIYEGTLGDKALYQASAIEAKEDDDTVFRAVWKPLDEFASGQSPLYPDGLLDLLWRHDAADAGLHPHSLD